MKNLALILIALMGTAVASHAQDGTKKAEPKKAETKKATSSKNKVVMERKKEQPIKKVN